jgi:hypothetical protein
MNKYLRKIANLFRQKIRIIIFNILCLSIINGFAYDFAAGKATFSIKFKDEISPYRIIGVFVLPKEKLTIEALDPAKNGQYLLKSSISNINKIKENRWQWLVPQEKGLYQLIVQNTQTMDSIVMNIFVMVPYKELEGEYLNSYRIGQYPTIPLKQLPIYKPPKGFIEVTKENEDTYISPHFKLKQFLCKQVSNYPKYLVLRERLLLKLELILEKVNEKGYKCNSFHIMSGYRTPYYNKAIGDVKYSRHVYGGAADIFIDENPKDGMMDDLNKDGKINYKDAELIYDIIDGMYGKPWYEIFIGGLGRYKKTASHGPFVHVDVRGFRARWGY